MKGLPEDLKKWLLYENDITQKQYDRLKSFSPETLRQIILEMAVCNPMVMTFLKNKWMTPPDDIPAKVRYEYDLRTKEPCSFFTESESDEWLKELTYMVLDPLKNASQSALDEAESFICYLLRDHERLLGMAGPAEGAYWSMDVEAALFRTIQRNSLNRPGYLKERLTALLNDPDFYISQSARQWLQQTSEPELKALLNNDDRRPPVAGKAEISGDEG